MFYELCRLCLNKAGVQSMFLDEDLPNEIFLSTGVRVQRGDNLPQNICINCLDVIQKAKELRLLAVSNDNHLRFLFEEDCSNINEIPKTIEKEVEVATTNEAAIEQPNYESSDCEPKLVIDEMTPMYTQSLSKGLSVRTDLFTSLPTDKKEKSKKHSKVKDIPKKTVQKEPSISLDHHKKLRKKSTEKEKNQCEEKTKKHSKVIRKKSTEKEENQCEEKTKKHTKVIRKKSTENEENQCEEKTKKHSKVIRKKSTENEEYQCEVCQKKFEVYKKFYLHQRSHNKSLFCPIDVCGKSFASRGDLVKHIRVHTGEKPFSCDICDRKFTQNVTLKQHKESVHASL